MIPQIVLNTKTISAEKREVKILFMYSDHVSIRIDEDGRAFLDSIPTDDMTLGGALRQWMMDYAQAQQAAPGDAA